MQPYFSYRFTPNYVSYNSSDLNINPYRAVLGKQYESLTKDRTSIKEGLMNKDSDYVPTQQFYKTHGNAMKPDGLQNAIQKEQIQPSIQNTTAYESQLHTINSNYYSLDNSIQTITNKNGTGVRDIMMKDSKYDFSGNVFQYDHPVSTKTDGLLEDIHTMTMYENSIYILGAITSATLLVGAIVMSNE